MDYFCQVQNPGAAINKLKRTLGTVLVTVGSKTTSLRVPRAGRDARTIKASK